MTWYLSNLPISKSTWICWSSWRTRKTSLSSPNSIQRCVWLAGKYSVIERSMSMCKLVVEGQTLSSIRSRAPSKVCSRPGKIRSLVLAASGRRLMVSLALRLKRCWDLASRKAWVKSFRWKTINRNLMKLRRRMHLQCRKFLASAKDQLLPPIVRWLMLLQQRTNNFNN